MSPLFILDGDGNRHADPVIGNNLVKFAKPKMASDDESIEGLQLSRGGRYSVPPTEMCCRRRRRSNGVCSALHRLSLNEQRAG